MFYLKCLTDLIEFQFASFYRGYHFSQVVTNKCLPNQYIVKASNFYDYYDNLYSRRILRFLT